MKYIEFKITTQMLCSLGQMPITVFAWLDKAFKPHLYHSFLSAN